MQTPGGRMGQGLRGFLVSRWMAFLLLAVFAISAITSISEKCTTYDEIAHLTGGYSYWLYDDYRLYPENGNLPQRWATLPLLLGDYRFPSLDQPDWWHSQVFALGNQFFYSVGNDLDEMLWRGRVMIVLLGIALGGVVYAWSRHIFGQAGGLISLTLYAFSPSMLAHSRLTTSDAAAALMFTASLACLWSTLHHVNIRRLLASGFVMGLLAVSKFSAILIGPVALILIVVRLSAARPLIVTGFGKTRIIRGRGRQFCVCLLTLCAHVALVIFVIWTFYGFRYSTFVDSIPGRDAAQFGETIDSLAPETPIEFPLKLMQEIRLLPETYLHALAFVLRDSGGSIQIAFLNGQYSYRGWWEYFPYCLLVKTPIAVFALLILAAVAAAMPWVSSWGQARHGSRRAWPKIRGVYHSVPLWVFLIVYWSLAVQHNVNLGQRYILPTYPAMFILAGAAGGWFNPGGSRRTLKGRPGLKLPTWPHRLFAKARLLECRRVLRAAVVVSLLELSVESLGIWPHYLAFFNQFAGGPQQGYRHLVDSALDWGQDLPGLKRRVTRQGLEDQPDTPVYLLYFGTGSPTYYGLQLRKLFSTEEDISKTGRPCELRAGVYCISATILQSLYAAAVGPWAVAYEQEYQLLLRWLELDATKSEDPKDPRKSTPAEMRQRFEIINRFEALRSARLCSYLRHREPDDHVGFSILIYRVTENDLQRFHHAPPVELTTEIEVQR